MPVPGRNDPSRRIGSAVSDGACRSDTVSSWVSWNSSWRTAYLRSSRTVLTSGAVGAALQADHPEPGLGQLAGEYAAGEPDADADRIDFLQNRRHGALLT
jgi:hypothetical protein